MKNRTKILAAVGLVTGLAVSGYAVNAYADGDGCRTGGHHKYAKRGMHMMETYDSNGDGALTLDEITAERGKKFKQFDANGDGVLILDEYQGLWMDAMRERMVDRFQKHDDDGDGKISADDFSKRFKRMMTWMDRNGDGKVDRDDRGYRHHDRD